MTLATLIRAGGLAEIMRAKAPANANAANFANDRAGDGPPLATLAPLALANPQGELTDTRPAHDTEPVTVTALTEAEREAIEYAERVAAIREQGKVPGSYTAITHCRHCGTVPIFAGAPARVDSCPWCHNRTNRLWIPRPSVQCRDCSHFTADPIGHGGIGTCARGGPPKGQMPAYPHAKRKCGDFEPKETAQ